MVLINPKVRLSSDEETLWKIRLKKHII